MNRINARLLVVLALTALAGGRTAHGMHSTVAPRFMITGIVTDQDGRAVSGAMIEAFRASDVTPAGAALSGNDGSYSLNLAPETYDFIITPPEGSGLGSAFVQKQTVTENTVLHFMLFALSGVRLTGQIADEQGAPLPNVTVQVGPGEEGPSQATQTDADGRFSFDVTPGAYRFILSNTHPPDSVAALRYTAETSFTVDTDIDLAIQLPLQPVTVRVQDLRGRRPAGVAITTTMTHTPSSFTTASLDWVGRVVYNDDATPASVTNEKGEGLLFLFPTAYDITARLPVGLDLVEETVSGIFVDGPLTQVITFSEEASFSTLPVAHAGADQTLRIGKTVRLDGSGSLDLDGDSLSYRWRFALPQPVTSTAEITGALTIAPSFVAHVPGVYPIELIVHDGALESAPDRVTMFVSEKSTPSFFARVARTERSVQSWMKAQRWPVYADLGVMAVGQSVYVRAQYANESDLIHPAQTLFDFGFNLSAYVLTNRFTDYVGASLLQNWMLQAFINTSLGYPLIWSEEPATYDLFGVDVPKFLYGDLRWGQLGIGLALIVLPRITRLR